MELKKLIIHDIPATLLDANTGFGGMQPSSTTWADDYRGHQAKGKLRRDHSWFTSLGPKDVASASVLGKQLYPLSYSANSFTLCPTVICLVQEATDLLTTNLQCTLKSFPG